VADLESIVFLTFHGEGEFHHDLGGGVGEVAGIESAIKALYLPQAQAGLPLCDCRGGLKT
jgi:hypothetical protein